jgi:hypothetical protein
MFRAGSLLMMIALAAPMVRECCLPVVQAPPCHESKHTDDVTCASNLQAIPETSAALNAPAIGYALPIVHRTESPFFIRIFRMLPAPKTDTTPPADLYLQTGALLI